MAKARLTAAQRTAILLALMDGKSLRKICTEPGAPSRPTVFRELAANHEFATAYAEARLIQADVLADEIVDIADNCPAHDKASDHPAKVKLQIDARKWMAAKLRPKVYGDKFIAEVTTDTDTANMLMAAAQRVEGSRGLT